MRVVVTGAGVVDGHTSGVTSRLLDETEARRLSRICQFTVAAARLALGEAGLDTRGDLALLVGTEFGDMVSTIAFVDGYLRGGPVGVSPLLFPHTVMNTMAATTAIAVSAKDLSLTLNAWTVAGELAIARGAAMIRAGRIRACLAGGADEPPPMVVATIREIGGGGDTRSDGAGFVVLDADSKAIAAALADAGAGPEEIGHVYTSASGDAARQAWEEALLDRALAPHQPPRRALSLATGRHSGLAARVVLTAAAEAGDGLALVHAIARGGNQVAIVVAGPGSRRVRSRPRPTTERALA
jgi:3-oxoacyl-[acyl-carrier-protein] synthase II